MSPKRVVERAVEMNLDIIAICDHNSAENVRAAVAAAEGKNLTVLPGMEITTVEEAHVLALFDDVEQALKLQELVYEHLEEGENIEAVFGEQIIANEFDEVEGYNKRILLGATTLLLEQVVEEVHVLGGLVIASHIDREAFSVIGQLGFIPEGLELDALEISANMTLPEALELYPEIENFPIITSSDAHFLEDIGTTVSCLHLDMPQTNKTKVFAGVQGAVFSKSAPWPSETLIVEINKAFKNIGGRRVIMEE
jgi:histidinol phosphatase-like PHP family hydrolase